MTDGSQGPPPLPGSTPTGDGTSPDVPPAPGYWKASDGNWYPPQPPAAAPPPPPPGPPPMGYGGPGTYQAYGPPVRSNGFATAALVLGIISIVLFWTFGFGIVLGILAVVFGVLGRSRAKEIDAAGQPDSLSGRATAGLVTGVLGVVGGALFIVLIVAAVDDIDFDQINTDPSDGVCDPDRFLQDPDC